MYLYMNINLMLKILFNICTLCIFVPIRTQISTENYACNVANCQVCSFVNFCGLCQNNYLLQYNSTNSLTYCTPIQCTPANCQTCYQNNQCSVCISGYYVSPAGICMLGNPPSTCGYRCLSCNSTYCLLCQFGYQLQNGYCFPIGGIDIQNCQSSFTAIFCQLCNTGYIVSPSYSCVSNPNNTCNSLSNCAVCRTKTINNQLICIQCVPGYQLNLQTCQPKTCNITNCAFCTNKQCTICQQQFSIVNNKCIIHTYFCNITNCVFCISADICLVCVQGYYPQQIYQNNTKISSQCIPFTSDQVTNCEILGPMIPGTTMLKIGCIKCQQYFIYVGGYCVANLTLSSYICNISNCLYCVQNNICAKCIQGYNVYIGSANQCTKIYSTVKNCEIGSLASIGCEQCSEGYVLVDNSYCIQINSIITCKVQGCSYCLINNTCAQCMQGYTKTLNTCQPLCQIPNCYQCNSKGNCLICNLNYYLNASECQPSDNQTSLYCILLDIHCSNCNYYNCTACQSGYTLNGGSCCPTPTQYNVANCTQYSTKFYPDCSSNVTCTECQQGALLINTYNPYGIVPVCVWLSCNLNITNCAYCYLSSVCKICQSGYYLSNNNTCIAYNVTECNVSNCVQCNITPQQCTLCLEGYLLYNGSCVCEFQNCLSCLGSISCTKCAYPTISSITSSTGCLPQNVVFSLCNVQNCLLCMQPNFCSQCAVGFTLLSNGTCYQNVCNRINNCILCNLQQSFCYNCLPGYIQTKNLSPGCSPIPANYSCQVLYCSLCQFNNPSNCSICAVFYIKNGDLCVPINCIQNCVFCLALSTCVICQAGFYLTNDNLCAIANSPAIQCPIIPNCVGCQLVGDTLIAICIQCLLGMQPSSDGLSCIPQNCTIPNCLVCDYQYTYKKATLCLVCNQGYYLNSYFQCTADHSLSPIPDCSNIYNCVFCSYDNYCVFCMLGWLPVHGRCITNQSTLCLVSNCLACTTGKICIKCSPNYTLTSNSTCSLNCNITNCAICVTQNLCQSCMNNMVVISGITCGCPDNSFQIINSTCVCQQLYAPNPSNLTCFFCDIQYCSNCQAENICAKCQNNLKVSSQNTCVCPDNTFQIINSTCICPENTTLYNNTTCIGCSIQYCLNCSSPNICSVCINNLTFTGDNICGCGNLQNFSNGYCVYCQVQYCVECESNNFCSACQNALLVVSSEGECVCNGTNKNYFNNTCVQCSISNCILCQQSNICLQCSPNYYGPNQNICIFCNIPLCAKCISPNYCTSCLNNLQVSSQGNLCVTCTIGNCTLCSIDDTCAVCDPGFQLVNPRLCVLCVLEGCAVCSQDNVCQICQASYTLTSSFTCTICIAPCATCATNSSILCLTCVSPFSIEALNNVCFNCYIPYCQQCSAFSLNLCKVCIPNYTVNSSGYCIYSGTCSINCISCLYGQVCQQCGPGYTISPLNQTQCQLCIVSNCYTCSPSDLTTCFICISGYYQSNGLCIICPFVNCQTCNSTSCITYQPSTYQNPIIYNNIQYAYMCDPGCTTCSSINPLSCIVCNQGFTLNQYRICIPCNYPCLQCMASNTSICISCYNNFYLNGTTCMQGNLTSNCLTFSSLDTSQCISCPSGYMLNNKTNTCSISCPLYCVSCSSQIQCMICIDGYSAGLAGSCLPCVSNCRKCAQSFQSVCLDCGIGFYLSNSTCVSCPQYCVSCNFMGCVSCLNGYFLNNQSKCIANCVPPCATCLQNSTTTCKSCLFGYIQTQNGSSVICTPQTTCDGGCQYCPLGYTYSNSSYAVCVNCFKNSNCSRCYSTNLTACVSCLNGYFLEIASSLCRPCPDECSSCTSSDNCLTCSSGYTIQGEQVLVPGICIKCLQPCSQCYINSYTCTACISGFVLNGWSCQSLFNFGFIMSLNATSQAFYQNYPLILSNLSSQINATNIQVITISSLSVLVGVIANQTITIIGNISTIQSPDSLTAYTQYISLSTLYTPNSILNNMTILSYQIEINNGELHVPGGSHELAIILGICIPLLILIIILIIYFFYIKKKKQTEDNSLTQQFNKIATKQNKNTPRQSQMSVYSKKIQEEISPVSANSSQR